MRNWREPDPEEMFLRRARVPGDTPPSGQEDFEPYSPDFTDYDGDDREDEDEPDDPGEAMMASPAALQVVDMSPTIRLS